MKKALLTLILVNGCNNAVAEWIYVAETRKEIKTENAFIAYADPATIKKEGKMIKMWSLYDYKIPQKSGIASVKQKSQYDCIEKKRRQLFLSAYSEKMNGGETILIYNQPNDNWDRAPLGSVRKAMLEYACGWHPRLPPKNFSNVTVAKAAQ